MFKRAFNSIFLFLETVKLKSKNDKGTIKRKSLSIISMKRFESGSPSKILAFRISQLHRNDFKSGMWPILDPIDCIRIHLTTGFILVVKKTKQEATAASCY